MHDRRTAETGSATKASHIREADATIAVTVV